MEIIKLETYKQPDGTEIVLRKVRMDWASLTDLCVERLVGKRVQEGCYGQEESVLQKRWSGWAKFEYRIGSALQ